MQRLGALRDNSLFNAKHSNLPKFKPVYVMPPMEQLPAYWQDYFKRADDAISENFYGNRRILKRALRNGDAYALQLQEIGYQFERGVGKKPKPAPFYQTVNWCLQRLQEIAASDDYSAADVMIPAKAFSIVVDGVTKYIFVPFGGDVPKDAKEENLLKPDVFVDMLSRGYFPVGAPIREHTNQTLCEHDIAHVAGFIAAPEYMRAVKQAFLQVGFLLKEDARIGKALANFDSLYSLRLYYMIEVFSIVPEAKKAGLQQLLGLKIDDYSLDNPEAIRGKLLAFLKAKEPAELNDYLDNIFEELLKFINPLGGESRDILNRTRKFARSNQSGSFYSTMSNLESKFDGSSIYSIIFNAMAALENIRSNHKDYDKAIELIYVPLLGTLIGTCQLSIKDWVDSAIAPEPDHDSKIFKYICRTGLWNTAHVLYHAYNNADPAKVLQKSDFTEDVEMRFGVGML